MAFKDEDLYEDYLETISGSSAFAAAFDAKLTFSKRAPDAEDRRLNSLDSARRLRADKRLALKGNPEALARWATRLARSRAYKRAWTIRKRGDPVEKEKRQAYRKKNKERLYALKLAWLDKMRKLAAAGDPRGLAWKARAAQASKRSYDKRKNTPKFKAAAKEQAARQRQRPEYRAAQAEWFRAWRKAHPERWRELTRKAKARQRAKKAAAKKEKLDE